MAWVAEAHHQGRNAIYKRKKIYSFKFHNLSFTHTRTTKLEKDLEKINTKRRKKERKRKKERERERKKERKREREKEREKEKERKRERKKERKKEKGVLSHRVIFNKFRFLDPIPGGLNQSPQEKDKLLALLRGPSMMWPLLLFTIRCPALARVQEIP